MQFVCNGHNFLVKYVDYDALLTDVWQQYITITTTFTFGGNTTVRHAGTKQPTDEVYF